MYSLYLNIRYVLYVNKCYEIPAALYIAIKRFNAHYSSALSVSRTKISSKRLLCIIYLSCEEWCYANFGC